MAAKQPGGVFGGMGVANFSRRLSRSVGQPRRVLRALRHVMRKMGHQQVQLFPHIYRNESLLFFLMKDAGGLCVVLYL